MLIATTSFGALTLLVGHQVDHPACKQYEWWGAGMVICLEQFASWCHCHPIISCFSLTFLVLAYPGCPAKDAIKRVAVCLLTVTTDTLKRHAHL